MANVPAILGKARLGNFKLGYESAALAAIRATRVHILLAGINVRVRVAGLTIRDILNDTPNTAALTISSPVPTTGQALRITINSDTPRLLFNGTIQTVDLSYEGKATNLVYPCTAIDDTSRANNRRPFGTWTLISATTIAQYLVTTYAPGFTSVNVQASLATVTITFDGSEDMGSCLARLATMIGGYFYWEDGDLHFFTTEATGTPDPIQTGYAFADNPPITIDTDESPLKTRVYGKGHGEAVPVDVLAAETIIPLLDAVLFTATGGQAIAGTTSDGAQSQVLTYTGTQLGGGGGLVGPGATPSTAPTLALATGTGLGAGVYKYAYTDITASGESLPSPLATITTSATGVAAPVAAPQWNGFNTGVLTNGGVYLYAYTYVNAVGESVAGPTMSITMTDPTNLGNAIKTIAIGPVGTTARKLYRTVSGGAQLKLAATISDNVTTTQNDGVADGSLGANAPSSPPAGQQVTVTAIAVGASPTTQRKLYRTAVGGSQLKLLATIADNTTLTYLDAIADGSLGANVPTSDTSLLTQPDGTVLAGSTSIIVSGLGPFASGGGWATLQGGQIIRYTGVSSTALTGVPATGAGSITATVAYNSTITAVPALTGVTGLTLAMGKGTPVHLWVQRDDLTAQAAAAIRESTATYTSTGIHEFLIIDERRGETSLTARCDAELVLYANPIVTVTYATRDVKTKSGKTIVVNLSSPAISQTLVIQEVTISEIDVAPSTKPKFTVKASTVRFSLEDILRRITT